MKYEFTISDKKNGQNRMSAGRNITLASILFYILLVLFHSKVSFDDLPVILFFTFLTLFGIFEYIKGKKIRDRNAGNWTFRVDANGVYLSTPDGLIKQLKLDKITAVEVIDIGDGEYNDSRYELVQENKTNLSLYLPLNIDYPKVLNVLKYYNINSHRLEYKSRWDYEEDIKKKQRVTKSFNDGFKF